MSIRRATKQLYSALGHCSLDRATVARKDKTWVLSKAAEESTKFVLVGPKGSTLIHVDPATLSDRPSFFSVVSGASAALLSASEVEEIFEIAQADLQAASIFLGLGKTSGVAYFATDVSSNVAEGKHPPLPAHYRFLPMRSVGPTVPADVANLLAVACGVVGWQSRNKFCSRSGQAVEFVEGGHALVSDADSRTVHPRMDPAVICLVEDEAGNVLMGRQAAWPPGVHSVLAGFCEVGESLEDAVVREVEEEAGVCIDVDSVRYFASQPWPFPQSLMIGFFASVPGTRPALNVDTNEVESADWFSKEEVHAALRGESDRLKVPTKTGSIAMELIKTWLGVADTDKDYTLSKL